MRFRRKCRSLLPEGTRDRRGNSCRLSLRERCGFRGAKGNNPICDPCRERPPWRSGPNGTARSPFPTERYFQDTTLVPPKFILSIEHVVPILLSPRARLAGRTVAGRPIVPMPDVRRQFLDSPTRNGTGRAGGLLSGTRHVAG